MNDEQQRARRNNYIMGEGYDRWKLRCREDDEEIAREQELRQELREQKEEWEWECRREDALTDPEPEIEMKAEPEKPLTQDELDEIEWRQWFRRDTERHWNREGCQ